MKRDRRLRFSIHFGRYAAVTEADHQRRGSPAPSKNRGSSLPTADSMRRVSHGGAFSRTASARVKRSADAASLRNTALTKLASRDPRERRTASTAASTAA